VTDRPGVLTESYPLVETVYWPRVSHCAPAHYWLRECVTTLAANL